MEGCGGGEEVLRGNIPRVEKETLVETGRLGRDTEIGGITVGRSTGLAFGRFLRNGQGTVVIHNLTEDVLPLENTEPAFDGFGIEPHIRRRWIIERDTRLGSVDSIQVFDISPYVQVIGGLTCSRPYSWV